VFLFFFSNPGPFGQVNQPGYPKRIQLVGKFASISSGRVPLSAMNIATLNQPKDVLTLNMLTDAIINAYRPGDIILIAMSQPASLCTGHQDLVRDISGSVPLYIYWLNHRVCCTGAVHT
jgi:hypothetical protein